MATPTKKGRPGKKLKKGALLIVIGGGPGLPNPPKARIPARPPKSPKQG